jgi:hypothetical protein
MRKLLLWIIILSLAYCWSPLPQAWAQGDPNAALFNEVIIVPLMGRSIAALITHKPGASKFTHAIALFPGSPGYGNLRMENGQVKIDKLGGNFLIRTRRHFLADDVLTVVIDAPSDRQGNFPHAFRETERYGEDVKGVLDAVSKRYGAMEWTFIGTSEGSVSAAHAGRMLSASIKRVVLTSSLVNSSSAGRGVHASDVKKISVPVLWVHHKHDPCKWTPYWLIKKYANDTQTALVTVTGAKNSRGNPCDAFSEHGYVGMEIKTIKAIMSWIRTGQTPADVSD